MALDRNTAEELARLTQELVAEGSLAVGAFAAQQGLHPTDVLALSHVRAAEDRGTPVTAGGLTRALGLTSGSVTAVVDRLERAGHLERVRDTADRRRVFLRYSPSGRAVADEFFLPLVDRGDTVTEHFTAAELEVVRRWLAATTADMASHRTPSAQTAPA